MSFVTGVGLCSPFGNGVDRALVGLAEGRTRARDYVLSGFTVMAATVPELDAASEALRSGGRPAQAFLCNAVEQAIAQSGIDPKGVPLFVGTCSGEMQRFERDEGPPDWYAQAGVGAANAFGLGTVTTFTSACTSSLSALAAAHSAIASGRIDRAIVAGTDATCTFAASGFFTLRAASARNALPFSIKRSGLNFGEGAAAIVLERTVSRAVARIDGVALACDAKHVTAPCADALGLERCVKRALSRSGHDPVDVYVTHGTATVANDAMELELGRRMQLLGKPWLAHKAFIGHAMGASALMSFVLANEQMRREVETRAPYSELEAGVVLDASLKGTRRALLAAAAFGGSNAALVWSVVS